MHKNLNVKEMKHSNTEIIVERYYRLRKWLVERDVPIKPETGKQFWSDLDILAVGEEVHLISCKDFLPSGKDIDRVIDNLEQSEKYIKREYKHLSSKIFKKFYVYGGTSKEALQKLEDKEIKTIEFKDFFVMYLKSLDEYLSKMNLNRKDIAKGKRYYIIGELEGLDKFMSFLLNNNFFNDAKINDILKKIKLEELSKLY
jgi:hypothetical protein